MCIAPGFARLVAAGQKKAARRPNILYIMSDDHSVNSIGAYNKWLSPYAKTPNIDRLANEGIVLTNCLCTNSLCAPSRASIITGQYSHKHGVYTLRELLDTAGQETLPVVLQGTGYQTAVIGKWHLDGDNTHGLDYYAITRGQGAYFDPSLETKDGQRRCRGHAPEAYTDLCLEWLGNRDRDKPFFLMCHHKAAHGLWQYAPRHAEMYSDETIPVPETFWDDFGGRPGTGSKSATIAPSLVERMVSGKRGQGWPTGNLDVTGLDERQRKKAAYQKYVKDYLRCVAGIDESVGRLYSYLKNEGILDNTLVIYTSDQGMYVGEHGFYDKRLMLEEALKMPFIARYPGAVRSGEVSDAIVNNVDFAPTLLDFAGLKVPAPMQGRSFWPVLCGKAATHRKASFYAFYSSGVSKHYGIRTDRHKLIVFADSSTRELYDLRDDPNEVNNRYNDPDCASLVRQMERRLQQAIEDVDIAPDQLPSARASGRSAQPKKGKRPRNPGQS
jgi:arylsulfatase A-like enzyme